MSRYKKGKVYQLIFEGLQERYIGSTCQPLKDRLSQHKSKGVNPKVQDLINTVGKQNVKIRLIESYPCGSKDELLQREQYWVDKLEPRLNVNKAYSPESVESQRATNIRRWMRDNRSFVCQQIAQTKERMKRASPGDKEEAIAETMKSIKLCAEVEISIEEDIKHDTYEKNREEHRIKQAAIWKQKQKALKHTKIRCECCDREIGRYQLKHHNQTLLHIRRFILY